MRVRPSRQGRPLRCERVAPRSHIAGVPPRAMPRGRGAHAGRFRALGGLLQYQQLNRFGHQRIGVHHGAAHRDFRRQAEGEGAVRIALLRHRSPRMRRSRARRRSAGPRHGRNAPPTPCGIAPRAWEGSGAARRLFSSRAFGDDDVGARGERAIAEADPLLVDDRADLPFDLAAARRTAPCGRRNAGCAGGRQASSQRRSSPSASRISANWRSVMACLHRPKAPARSRP